MSGLLSDSWLLYLTLFITGFVAYIISTLSGGGGALLLVPIVNLLIGTKSTAPVINLGNLVGEPVRIILFWKDIEWKIVKYYLPSAIGGTVLGAVIFVNVKLEWLQIVVGLFLISTIFQYRFGKMERSFEMKLEWFITLGFIVELLTTIIGAVGPVLNPFYLNYGLQKEKMIATKTMNSFVIGLAQISSYAALGSLKGNLWLYGVVLGAGASAGNWLGKNLLKNFSNDTFRKFVIAIMVLSGTIMIARQIMKG